MATRFRLPFAGSAPVSPAIQSYTHVVSTQRFPLLTSDNSALGNNTLNPDAADHLVAGDSFNAQFVSEPLATQTFTGGDAVKYAVQAIEGNAGNNLFVQLWIGIVSYDGSTALATLLSKTLDDVEVATSLTSRTLSTTLTDGYTTSGGERLVVEFSLSGTPTAAGGTQGHNGGFRLGSSGAGGDLLENDTQTGFTLNGWLEFANTIFFYLVAGFGLYIETGKVATLLRGYRVAADSGAYTLTGTAATPLLNRVIAADAGAFTETGTSASLSYGLKLAADAGSYIETGTAATFPRTHRVTVDSGSFSETGTAAALLTTYRLAAETAAYSLTGADASLEYGSRISSEVGSFTETGTAASLERGFLISCVGGSYAWTGTAADLIYTPLGAFTIAAESGTYSETGIVASLEFGRVISIAAGAFSETGTDAGLEHGYLISCDSGSYTLTGASADLIYAPSVSFVIAADSGAYSETGAAAFLEYGRVIPIAAGSFAETGTASALEYGRAVAADSGTYAETGSVAALRATHIIGAGAGSYSETGTALGLSTTKILFAGSGTYELGGILVDAGEGGLHVCREPREFAFTLEQLEETVEINSECTTCPFPHVFGSRAHKEPRITRLPGDAADSGYTRSLVHTRQPDGTWRTTSVALPS